MCIRVCMYMHLVIKDKIRRLLKKKKKKKFRIWEKGEYSVKKEREKMEYNLIFFGKLKDN